jgi:hypothetical protein
MENGVSLCIFLGAIVFIAPLAIRKCVEIYTLRHPLSFQESEYILAEEDENPK